MCVGGGDGDSASPRVMTQELEEAFRWRHEEALRAERHSHQMALRALEERAQAEAQAERLRQQTQQKLLLGNWARATSFGGSDGAEM